MLDVDAMVIVVDRVVVFVLAVMLEAVAIVLGWVVEEPVVDIVELVFAV